MKWSLAVMLSISLSLATAGSASADAPKDGSFATQRLTDADMADLLGSLPTKSAAATPEVNPVILKALGGLQWGMGSQAVIAALEADATLDTAKLRKSYVTFDGQATQWEDSVVAGHYTHGNGEAMLVVERDGVRSHLFFIQDKLWKLFETVGGGDASANFHGFARELRGRFGVGHVRTVGDERWIEFGSKRTRVRGLDGGDSAQRYGVVLEDRPTLAKLQTMRVATIEPVKLAPVAPVKLEQPRADAAAIALIAAADQMRSKTEAPSAKVRDASAAAKALVAAPTTGELDAMAVVEDDDPLTGL